MLTHRGGNIVAKGTYWNLARGERVDIADKGQLPGDNSTMYVKMSTLMVLIVGPVIGLLYAVFLPFIGISMTLVMIGKKLTSGLVRVAVKSTTFGWRPIEAYLDGKQRRKKETREKNSHGKT